MWLTTLKWCKNHRLFNPLWFIDSSIWTLIVLKASYSCIVCIWSFTDIFIWSFLRHSLEVNWTSTLKLQKLISLFGTFLVFGKNMYTFFPHLMKWLTMYPVCFYKHNMDVPQLNLVIACVHMKITLAFLG